MATDVFAELGFDGTTTREIAKRAGVNVAAMNYHWGSKEKLWLAACETSAAKLSATVLQTADMSLPPKELVARLVGAVFDALVEDPRPIRIATWAMLQAESIDLASAAEKFRTLIALGLEYFRGLRAAGKMPDLDVEVFLATFYGEFVVVFIDQPGHRLFFGSDVSDPKHAARVRRSLVRSAVLRLGL